MRGLALLFFTLAVAHPSEAPGNLQGISRTSSEEVETARQDMAAIAALQASIARYESILGQKRDLVFQRQIQMRIGEILYEMASAQYRLVYLDANRIDPAQKRNYENTLKRIVEIETRLIREEPSSPNLARYFYLLAQALKELGQDSQAIEKYRYLIDRFPGSEDVLNAHISLHDLLVKKKDYRTAITYLKKLKIGPDQKEYGLIQDYFAFDYYYLGDLKTAYDYLRSELKFFIRTEKPTASPKEVPENFELSKLLKNMALFYDNLMAADPQDHSASQFFYELVAVGTGREVGKALRYFGTLLRARNNDIEFESLKTLMVKAKLQLVDSVEFLISALDKEVARKELGAMKVTSERLLEAIQAIRKEGKDLDEQVTQVNASLQKAAATLQTIYVGTNDLKRKAETRSALISLYKDLLVLSENKQRAAGQVHYNLGELYFSDRDYAHAVPHYLWIFKDHRGSIEDRAMIRRAHFRAIVARYEDLSRRNLIPTSVQVKSIRSADKKSIDSEIADWMDWVKAFLKAEGLEGTFDLYYFSMIQILYVKGHIEKALDESQTFMDHFKGSKYFIPTASLVLDTYFASQKWEDTRDAAGRILKRIPASQSAFRSKVEGIVAECFFKEIEELYHKKDYADAIEKSEQFIKAYPGNKRIPDAMSVAAHSAVGLNDKKKALEYFSPLMKNQDSASSEVLSSGYLTQASVAEEAYNWIGALRSYRSFLALSPGVAHADGKIRREDAKNIEEKILFYSWLSGDLNLLRETLTDRGICSGDLTATCAKYSSYVEFKSGRSISSRSDWSFILSLVQSFERRGGIDLDDRLRSIEKIVSEWEKQEPLLRYSLLSNLSKLIHASLQKAVEEVRRSAPLKLDKKRINRRVELISKTERTFEKVLSKTSWIQVRCAALHQWANLYFDLSREFDRIPRPSGVTRAERLEYEATIRDLRKPFLEKGQEILKKANEAGSLIRVDHMSRITQALLSAFDEDDVEKSWRASFTDSIRRANWPKVAYLIQVATEHKKMNSGSLALGRAVSFCAAGASADCLSELKESEGRLPSKAREIYRNYLAEKRGETRGDV